MSEERTTGEPPAKAEPSQHGSALTDLRAAATLATRLQILTAEHSSLVATRSLSWNESFARASMFLSTVSGAIVALALIGMNRIRAGYLEIAPDLERFFVMSAHDDVRGVGVTMGSVPGVSPLVHLIAATPMVISVVNSVIAASIVGLGALLIQLPAPVILGAGVIAFPISLAAHGAYGRKNIARGQASIQPLFPTPAGDFGVAERAKAAKS